MIVTDRFVVLMLPKTGTTFVQTTLRRVHGYSARRKMRVLQRGLRRMGLGPAMVYEEIRVPRVPHVPGGATDTKHGVYTDLPSVHREKPIVSVVRNPYVRFAALQPKSWVKQLPLEVQELRRRFPHFPNFTISDCMALTDLWVSNAQLPDVKLRTPIGPQTVQFVRMFFKDPERVLRTIDEDYIRSDQFVEDIAPNITLLQTENLNRGLYEYLLQNGYAEERIRFILDHEKVNVTARPQKRSEILTDEVVEFVSSREAFLLRILSHYGIDYEAP